MAYKNPIPKFNDSSETSIDVIEADYTEIKQVYFAFIDVLGFKKTFDDIRISKQTNHADKDKWS